jgi:hypothetical protein
MEILLKIISENIVYFAGAFLAAALTAHYVWRNNFKSRHAAACAAFRSDVLAELGSVYPNASEWPDNIHRNGVRSCKITLHTSANPIRPFLHS